MSLSPARFFFSHLILDQSVPHSTAHYHTAPWSQPTGLNLVADAVHCLLAAFSNRVAVAVPSILAAFSKTVARKHPVNTAAKWFFHHLCHFLHSRKLRLVQEVEVFSTLLVFLTPLPIDVNIFTFWPKISFWGNVFHKLRQKIWNCMAWGQGTALNVSSKGFFNFFFDKT